MDIQEDNRAQSKAAFTLLLICSGLSLALWFLPYVGFLTYPFRIFVTLIHETGHALASWLTFGQVNRIELDWSGNGVTWTNGGVRLLISSAGYLGATAYGAGLLLLLRRARMARVAAFSSAAVLLAITIFLAGNLTVWVAGMFFGLGLLGLSVIKSQKVVHFFMSFLAVQCVMNALFDLRTLIYLSAFEPSRHTDAQNMAAATNQIIPAAVWAIGWAVVSFAILAFTLVIYYRGLRAQPAPAALLPLANTAAKQASA
jgi:hypothetical protein